MPGVVCFEPNNPNEGQSHEDLLLQILAPNFNGSVIPSPKIKDGSKARELCVVLALAQHAFLFEAKSFSVFDKSLDQTAERKARTVMKHFEKAIGQLQGATRRLEEGIELLGNGLPENRRIAGSDYQTVHGIVVVSNSSFDLPWRDIGRQLAEAQKPPRTYYHLLSLMETQRMVAFAKGSAEELNQIFKRRAEIVAASGNAHVRSDYITGLPSSVRLPPASGNCMALRFVWFGHQADEWLEGAFPVVYALLLSRGLSGRLDFYHRVDLAKGVPAIGIGLVLNGLAAVIDASWWKRFQLDLFQAFARTSPPIVVPKSVKVKIAKEVIAEFPELLLTVEFEAGFVVAKQAGELTPA